MKLEGSLAERGFADLVQELHEGRWTGGTTLTHKGVGKTVTVKQGQLVFAASSDPDDRLGELLLRQGRLKLWDLVDARPAVSAGQRLGGVLVERSILSSKQLIMAVTHQVEEILYSLFQWTEGRYRLQPGPAPAEAITLKISTPHVILEGIGRIDAWSRIERGIGGNGAQYRRAEDYEMVLAQMSLSFERLSLLTDLNGVKDVRAICAGSSLTDFEVCRTLWAFRIIGVVRLVAGQTADQQTPEDGLELALESPPDANPAPPPPPDRWASAAKKSILLVGLEREVLDRIDPLLSRAMFAVERVPEARAAADRCQRRPFDLIVARYPLSAMALKDFLGAVWRDGGACAASQLLVLAEAGRLGELKGHLREGQSLTLPVTEPRKLLEEMACRLLGARPRTSARLIVKLTAHLEQGSRLVAHQTDNISETGMLLRTETLYPTGTKVTFEALLPVDGAPIQGEAEVVRHAVAELEGVQGVGMKFLSFKGDGLARLQDFIAVKRSAPLS